LGKLGRENNQTPGPTFDKKKETAACQLKHGQKSMTLEEGRVCKRKERLCAKESGGEGRKNKAGKRKD